MNHIPATCPPRKRRSLFLSIILPVSLVALACITVLVRSAIQREQAARASEKTARAREKETAAALQEVAVRQQESDSLAAIRIDLTAYTNCTLAYSFVPKRIPNNNLEELPTGPQRFGGTPFKITGRIQLWGTGLASFGVQFPKQVEGIRISAKCRKIHLFHGALFVDRPDIPIARLVVHYQDGSQGQLEIITGQHVLDWWGPVYKAGVPENIVTVTAEGSELAWVGGNPYIRARKPELAIRLYKSTFDNPEPAKEITSMDYVSTETRPASFLLGMAVE